MFMVVLLDYTYLDVVLTLVQGKHTDVREKKVFDRFT